MLRDLPPLPPPFELRPLELARVEPLPLDRPELLPLERLELPLPDRLELLVCDRLELPFERLEVLRPRAPELRALAVCCLLEPREEDCVLLPCERCDPLWVRRLLPRLAFDRPRLSFSRFDGSPPLRLSDSAIRSSTDPYSRLLS